METFEYAIVHGLQIEGYNINEVKEVTKRLYHFSLIADDSRFESLVAYDMDLERVRTLCTILSSKLYRIKKKPRSVPRLIESSKHAHRSPLILDAKERFYKSIRDILEGNESDFMTHIDSIHKKVQSCWERAEDVMVVHSVSYKESLEKALWALQKIKQSKSLLSATGYCNILAYAILDQNDIKQESIYTQLLEEDMNTLYTIFQGWTLPSATHIIGQFDYLTVVYVWGQNVMESFTKQTSNIDIRRLFCK